MSIPISTDLASTPPWDELDEFDRATLAMTAYQNAKARGEIDPEGKLANQYIAYYDGAVIDHDHDYVAMKARLNQRTDLDLERLITEHNTVFDFIPG